jgi:mono/diheme cytochrome c family protein
VSGRGEVPGAARRAAAGRFALPLAVVLLAAGCDNIVKAIPTFATMSEQPSVETFEHQPVAPPDGAVPVDGSRHLTLLQADSLARNPLTGTAEEVERGKQIYENFCLPCHGADGTGSGPVINKDGSQPRRLPFIPAVDLATGPATTRTDGYIWGMIANGRGLMPSYDRVSADQRWYVVEYVRHLQKVAADSSAAASGAGTP